MKLVLSIYDQVQCTGACAWILSYPLCYCENTGQTIIKRRCGAGCSFHLILNLFVSSADKLNKTF